MIIVAEERKEIWDNPDLLHRLFEATEHFDVAPGLMLVKGWDTDRVVQEMTEWLEDHGYNVVKQEPPKPTPTRRRRRRIVPRGE